MRVTGIGAAASLALVAGGCLPQRPPVEVQVEPRGGQTYLVTYAGLSGTSRLDLGPKDPARAGAWSVETAGVALVAENGRDVLAPTAKDGALPAVVAVRVVAEPMPAPTATVLRLGETGGLVRTGRIIPYKEKNPVGRISIVSGAGYRVESDAGSAPAFVFVGETETRSAPAARLVFAEGVPAWIVEQGEGLAARLLPALEARAGRAPKAPLEMFVGLDGAAEGLAVETARAPDQVVVELKGAGWRDGSPDSAEIFHRAAASEFARHWLSGAGRKLPDTWIGDGLADALADETLVAAGYWTADDAEAVLGGLHADCATALGASGFAAVARNRELARACAHAFARAAAGEKGVGAFARDLGREAGKSPPDGDDFLKVASRHAGPHNAALMRTLMTAQGDAAADALAALRFSEQGAAARSR